MFYAPNANDGHKTSAVLQDIRNIFKRNMPPNSKEVVYIQIYSPNIPLLAKSRGYSYFNGRIAACLIHNMIYKSEVGI